MSGTAQDHAVFESVEEPAADHLERRHEDGRWVCLLTVNACFVSTLLRQQVTLCLRQTVRAERKAYGGMLMKTLCQLTAASVLQLCAVLGSGSQTLATPLLPLSPADMPGGQPPKLVASQLSTLLAAEERDLVKAANLLWDAFAADPRTADAAQRMQVSFWYLKICGSRQSGCLIHVSRLLSFSGAVHLRQ